MPLFDLLATLIPPAPHANHYMCETSFLHPQSSPNPTPQIGPQSQSQILRLPVSVQTNTPSIHAIMSVGGGGIVITPLSFLEGFRIHNGDDNGKHNGKHNVITPQRDFLALLLTCKTAQTLNRSHRLRPHVIIAEPLSPPSAHSRTITRLAVPPKNKFTPTSNSIPSIFRIESSGLLGTLPPPSLLSLRLNTNLNTPVTFLPTPPSSKYSSKHFLTSYPRSGNTLIRSLLQTSTKIWTGSDTAVSRTLGWRLASNGMCGEGVIDSRVNCVKTHWPERTGWGSCVGSKVVLVVRNFWDAIDSYFNMCLSNTHDESLREEVRVEFWGKWERMVRWECVVWQRFNDFWVELCEKNNVPLMIVRFEDLVSERREATMGAVLSFIGDGDNTGSDASSGATTGGYKPRSGGVGSSFKKGRFSAELIAEIEATIKPSLERFGYQNLSTLGANPDVDGQSVLEGLKITSPTSPDSPLTPITINDGDRRKLLRKDDDEFGRQMTNWRRSHTNNDTRPFPTINKNK